MENNKQTGYIDPFGEQSKTKQIANLRFFLDNDPEKSQLHADLPSGETIRVEGDALKKVLEGTTFFHVVSLFRKQQYDTDRKETSMSTTEYRHKTDKVTIYEYGQKSRANVDIEEVDKLFPKCSTLMINYVVAVLSDGRVLTAFIKLTATGRNAFFEKKYPRGGGCFKLGNRETTEVERAAKWSNKTYYPEVIASSQAEGMDYEKINWVAMRFSEEITAKMPALFAPAPTVPYDPTTPAPTAPAPTAPAPTALTAPAPPAPPALTAPAPTAPTAPILSVDDQVIDDLPF